MSDQGFRYFVLNPSNESVKSKNRQKTRRRPFRWITHSWCYTRALLIDSLGSQIWVYGLFLN